VHVEMLYKAVAIEAIQQELRVFNPQELANIVWAFAKAGVCSKELYEAVSDEAVR